MLKNLAIIFEQCFVEVTDKESINQKEVLRENFLNRIANDQTLNELEKLIRLVTLFKDTKGSAREKFLEICFDQSLLTRELLTHLYLSVHTYAKPYQYFTSEKINEIFERIITPFTCIDSKNKIEKLNDTFNVYRGLRDSPADLDNCGVCWTLDEKIAIKFATADGQTTGFVVNGQTNKSLIKGYVTWRDEKEIIVKARDVSEKTVYQVPHEEEKK